MTRSGWSQGTPTLAIVLLAAWLAGCAPMGEKSPAPQITEAQLREKAKESLANGLRQYQEGQYEDAQKSLMAALDHGLLSHTEQSTARKNLAFMYCVTNRTQQCEDEFRKAMEIDPSFDLTPAEIGHPIWGPVYKSVRAQLTAPPPTPEPKPRAPRTLAEQHLADGMARYEAGEFNSALKLLQEALKEGLTDKPDQIKAHKNSAFSLCLLHRITACRNEFMKIFDIDPAFDLAPAEAGHPSWSKTFVRAKQLAREKQDKEKNAVKGAAPRKQ
jgi:Tfp pilus assembly protein PilF